MYEPSCFECAADEFYNLDTLACVDKCSKTQHVEVTIPASMSVTGQDMHLCRNRTMYVNPESKAILELGTE